MNKRPYTSCACRACRSLCEKKPGWFLPEQVPALEAFLGKPLAAMLGRELAIDCYPMNGENVPTLSPNIVGNDSEGMSYPFGQCVFFKNDRCQVYPVRPYECAWPDHHVGLESDHREVAMEWLKSELLKGFKVEVEII